MPEEENLEMVTINGVECRTFKEMILYKIDRTFAILGIIFLGSLALGHVESDPTALNITMAAIAGLVGYVGGRTGK